MGFLKDFKDFAMRGNVLDMAVGVIIGGAFGKIVSSLVNNVIMPLLGKVVGGIDFTSLKWVLAPEVLDAEGNVVSAGVEVEYGIFLQNTLDFIIIAFCVFVMVRVVNKLINSKKKESKPAVVETPADVKLLTEIRDLLREQNKAANSKTDSKS